MSAQFSQPNVAYATCRAVETLQDAPPSSTDTANRKDGRENQGVAPDRNRGQYAPNWEPWPGEDAAMRTYHPKPDRRHSVITTKASGAKVCFGVYQTLIEAERTCSMLGKIGCIANVEAARRMDAAAFERREAKS